MSLRSIPSIDRCIKDLLAADAALAHVPQDILKALANLFWDEKREDIKKGIPQPDPEKQFAKLLQFVRRSLSPTVIPVLNGTGVVIHTNLGRSLLAEEACKAVAIAAANYCALEMDMQKGERGSRHAITAQLLRLLTGAEDSMVVNNNAAAVLLILDTLCKGGETIVSRGELVEIGGSFRIPDIMAKSGTILKEVGTTNRTRLEDYRHAITEHTRAIMRVHTSNFRIIGFHEAATLKELGELARENSLPLVVDLGSGSLLDFPGLPPEPDVKKILQEGADVVCFSGDKTLGGPQAGIIVGNRRILEALKKNPLTRALRCDKLCLAALEATLRLYLDPRIAKKSVPTAAMIGQSSEELEKSARSLAARIRRALNSAHIPCKVDLKKDFSRVGGGSFPEWGLPTTLICLAPSNMSAHELRRRLLTTSPPLIGRLDKNTFCLDPRTLVKKDYPLVIQSLLAALR